MGRPVRPGRLLTIEGAAFISVYIAYGLLSRGFSDGSLAQTGWPLYSGVHPVCDQTGWHAICHDRVVYLKQIAEVPEDITPTLSTGISMDHVVSIALAAVGGWAWVAVGPEYVFYVSAILSIFNVIISMRVTRETKEAAGQQTAAM
jgi:hypothetical protein